MKWKPTRTSDKVRPFLVLPLLETERSVSAESLKKGKIPPGLRLMTRNISAGMETWPPKLKQKKSKKREARLERPLTATLERPEVLNINLIDKIDMSLVRKEFLCITNLCRLPVSKSKRSSSVGKKRLLKPPPKCLTPGDASKKRSRRPETSESSLEEDEASIRSKGKTFKLNKITKSIKTNSQSSLEEESSQRSSRLSKTNDTNNNGLQKTHLKRHSIESKRIDEVFSGPKTTRSLPEPCTTCGRPDLPERFHSHPNTPFKPPRKEMPRKVLKNTVQKPVAIKYKSKEEKGAIKKEKLLKSPVKGPKMVVCYICGREFGTSSLPLHEPKCLQKWERENSLLPRHQQRKAPQKPDKPMSTEEWNKFAWESSQASLTPCEHCGRTFLPDRLPVHQRSCKPGSQKGLPTKTAHPSSSTSPQSGMASPVSPGPPSVPCYVCGRLFGTKSIGIHEPQCLKKWHVQNNLRPVSHRLPTPIKNASPMPSAVPPPTPVSEAPSSSASPKPSSGGPKKPMLPCYICGREYGTSSIYIHEPQCLKKWNVENDKLPPGQRRKEPTKPDIIFTPSGQIDYQATNEKIWQSHLNQLIACQHCGRTFNPDRVTVHQKSCKG